MVSIQRRGREGREDRRARRGEELVGFATYLGSLLTSLRLGEGRGSRLLAGLGRLSLRKKDISKCGPLPGDLP